MPLFPKSLDKAGEHYWTALWRQNPLPRPIRLRGVTPGPAYWRQFHHLWRRYLPQTDGCLVRFLEVGCARSLWLPYFAQVWGYEVSGLDYSQVGCQQARFVLAREGVRGTIFGQDLFSPQSNQIESYDVVFSMGVVEHFPDTLKVLEAISAYLRPGGVMVTIIPNYTGWLGKMKGWLNRESLERHELLTKEELQEMHQSGGFQTRYCGYHIFFDPNCLHPGPQWPAGLQRLFLRLRRLPEILVGLVWLTLPTVRLNRQTASCIVYLGERELGKSRASGQ